MSYAIVRKGPIPRQNYGLTPSADYMASLSNYGLTTLSPEAQEKKERWDRIIRVGIRDGIATLFVGPALLKNFYPEMSYKQRTLYAGTAVVALTYIARAYFDVED